MADRYRKRFGEIALDLGFVSPAQIYEALAVQARRKSEGKAEKLLGQILLELGYLQTDQVQQVIEILYPVSPEN